MMDAFDDGARWFLAGIACCGVAGLTVIVGDVCRAPVAPVLIAFALWLVVAVVCARIGWTR